MNVIKLWFNNVCIHDELNTFPVKAGEVGNSKVGQNLVKNIIQIFKRFFKFVSNIT